MQIAGPQNHVRAQALIARDWASGVAANEKRTASADAAPASASAASASAGTTAGHGKCAGKYERHLALAREAALNGDPIEAENYYQHAEHYFRMMSDQEGTSGLR